MDATAHVSRWPFIRDLVLFLAGLAGVAHETLSEHVDRPQLLLVFAGMLGLPAFLRKNGGGNGK